MQAGAAPFVGRTDNVSVNYSQPIASSESGLLVGSLTAGSSNTRNFLSGADLGSSRTHRAGVGLTYSYVAPGRSVVLAANGLYANAPTAGRIGKTEFGVFSGTGSAEHLFGSTVGLRLAGGWQVASVPFVSSDLLFQIGGSSTVRGYREGELTGDGGFFVNAEAELFPIRKDGGSLVLFTCSTRTGYSPTMSSPSSLPRSARVRRRRWDGTSACA